MNECLITKLKGAVQNDNLPVYDTIKLSYNGSVPTRTITIYFACPETVTIKSKVPFHLGNVSTPTTYTEWSGTLLTISAVVFEALGTTPIENLIEFTPAYKLTHFACNQARGFNKNTDALSGLSALTWSLNAIGYSWWDDAEPTVIQPTVRGMYINKPTTVNSPLPANNIELFTSDNFDGTQQGVSLSALVNCAEARVFHVRVMGDVKNLPVKTKTVCVGAGALTGSVEELVAEMRAKGRISGAIVFSDYSWQFTYNGNPVGLQMGDNIPWVNTGVGTLKCIVLTWDASSIIWADSLPTEVQEYVAVWGSYYQYFTRFTSAPQD